MFSKYHTVVLEFYGDMEGSTHLDDFAAQEARHEPRCPVGGEVFAHLNSQQWMPWTKLDLRSCLLCCAVGLDVGEIGVELSIYVSRALPVHLCIAYCVQTVNVSRRFWLLFVTGNEHRPIETEHER